VDGPGNWTPGVCDALPGCSEPCCRPPCGPPGRFWVSGEYLLWWIKDTRVPPLVTQGTTLASTILGQGATILVGPNTNLNDSATSGARFTAGMWLNDCQTFGIEASYFFLDQNSRDFSAGGNGTPGSPAIGRPFFNTVTGREDAEAVATPGVLSGTVHVGVASQLQGAEVNALCNLCCDCWYRLDVLGGFSYLNFRDRVLITENLSVLPGTPVIGGTRFDLFDRFDAHNDFYGGQIGLRGEVRFGRVFADLIGKVALGDLHEHVDINGATRTTSPTGVVTTLSGGLLAQSSNIGSYNRDKFAVLPQGTINVGYQVTNGVRVWVGYTLLYLSDVVRAGEQIDRVVNPTLIPATAGGGPVVGALRPAFSFRDTDFWAQGVNFGLELRF
jgi:hypothetical protein